MLGKLAGGSLSHKNEDVDYVTRTFWNRLLLESYPKEALSCLISKVAQKKKNTGTKVLMF